MRLSKRLAGGALAVALSAAAWAPVQAAEPRRTVTNLEFLGEVQFPTGFTFAGTEVGGLSGVAYDADQDLYFALSDDRGAPRFYTLRIDVSDGTLDDGDVMFDSVVTLLDGNGQPFAPGATDPEGIAILPEGPLVIASEGDANQLFDPFINVFARNGQQLAELPIPDRYKPTADQSAGIRNNLAFESLTITPDGRFLITATENALFQDGPNSTVDTASNARVLVYDLTTGQPVREHVFVVDAVPEPPIPAGAFNTNGLVELLSIDNNGTLLALERAFSVGQGNTVRLFESRAQGALDVSGLDDLFDEVNELAFEIDPPLSKEQLLDVEADLGVAPDNLEALVFGPLLPDGRQSFFIVSDNNFNPNGQFTQFLGFAIEFDTLNAAMPVLETPQAVDIADADSPLTGDSDDPAIWVNPFDRARSLVLATQKDGGLVVFDLHGNIVQTILPAPFGDIRYNNVDLTYNFLLDGRRVDLAVVSDRANDTLAIFAIDPVSGLLSDVTSPSILDTIFGVDDGEATAYGLATFTSPVDGKDYAFVTQADGSRIAQLELVEVPGGLVSAEIVREIDLTDAAPDVDADDLQSEAMVVDRRANVLYIAVEEELGIVKIGAEPTDGTTVAVAVAIDEPFFEPDLEGLTIYYGDGGDGVLIASSQGDSTYAIFTLGATNDFLGSFVIGDALPIDQANESDGIDVLNMSLGANWPAGIFIAQDGADERQVVVEDEEELENSATNFKFVRWESVAGTLPGLPIDPAAYDVRGDVLTQIDRLLGDLDRLVGNGDLKDGKGKDKKGSVERLFGSLLAARAAYEQGESGIALAQLRRFGRSLDDVDLAAGLARTLLASASAAANAILIEAVIQPAPTIVDAADPIGVTTSTGPTFVAPR